MLHERLVNIIRSFSQRKLLIVGDSIADKFLYGSISRVSREAPVFILRHELTETVPGGAAKYSRKQIDDLGGNYGAATAEDRRDIQENLSDLAEHVDQGNETLIQQDLAVLKRSVQNVRDDSDDVQDSAWNGFAEGIQECATD